MWSGGIVCYGCCADVTIAAITGWHLKAASKVLALLWNLEGDAS